MALDLTSFASALKQHYTSDRIENMVYKNNPFLALVPKKTDFGGKNLPIPIIYGNPQGRSATFSTAQANKTSSKITDFVLTRNHDYALASIDNETLEASKGNQNAFMEAATTEIDGAISSITRSLAISLFRSGSGSIGQSLAAYTSTSLTLKETADVTNFEVGMELVFSTADGGGTVTSVAGTGTVGGITLSGTVTTSGNLTLSGTPSFAASAITSGTIDTARLASGTASSSTYLRGDSTWVSSIPISALALLVITC